MGYTVDDATNAVLSDVCKERNRQDELLRAGKFSWTCASPEVCDSDKLAVLAEEFGEAAKEVTEGIINKTRGSKLIDQTDVEYVRMLNGRAIKDRLRKELIQVAAVCVAWCEALDIESRIK